MANLYPREHNGLGLKLVYSFINFIIPLPVTHVKDIPDETAKDWQSAYLSEYSRELLDVQVYWIFWKIFFLKKEIWNMGEEYGQWCCRFKFLKGIRLHWLYELHAGEMFKVMWFNKFKFFVFGNIKRVFGRFSFTIQTNIFFLKLKMNLTKADISCVKYLNSNVRQADY